MASVEGRATSSIFSNPGAELAVRRVLPAEKRHPSTEPESDLVPCSAHRGTLFELGQRFNDGDAYVRLANALTEFKGDSRVKKPIRKRRKPRAVAGPDTGATAHSFRTQGRPSAVAEGTEQAAIGNRLCSPGERPCPGAASCRVVVMMPSFLCPRSTAGRGAS
jgi:hypothetical protein